MKEMESEQTLPSHFKDSIYNSDKSSKDIKVIKEKIPQSHLNKDPTTGGKPANDKPIILK